MGNVTSSGAGGGETGGGRFRVFAAVSVMALLLAGQVCGAEVPLPPEAQPRHAAGASSRDEFSATGTVQHVGLEGGFWGIIGDDGKRYDTPNLPGEFREQGLRVRFIGRARPDRISYHMWGTIVEIISVERIGKTNDQPPLTRHASPSSAAHRGTP